MLSLKIGPLRLGRVLGLAAAGLALLLALWWVTSSWFGQPQPIDPQQIREAVQAFCRDRQGLGIRLPPTVTLRELVKAGYLRPETIRGMGSAEVTITLKPDQQKPGSVLMEARLPDGSRLGALSDGTVQRLETPPTNH